MYQWRNTVSVRGGAAASAGPTPVDGTEKADNLIRDGAGALCRYYWRPRRSRRVFDPVDTEGSLPPSHASSLASPHRPLPFPSIPLPLLAPSSSSQPAPSSLYTLASCHCLTLFCNRLRYLTRPFHYSTRRVRFSFDALIINRV